MSEHPDLTSLLAMAVERQASDLHIHWGTPPLARVHGEIVPILEEPLDAEACHHLVFSGLTEIQQVRLQEDLELDFVLNIPDLGRFRCNAHYARGCVEAAYRHIRGTVGDLEALGHRPIVTELCRRKEGLILVTGHSGMGKTTTMAAMVQWISRFRSGVIITIEDPVEYNIAPALGIVKQREVGTDTKSFASGLRNAARQDPDVIVIGEMRDPETMQAALTAAETGHLVIGTLHTIDASKTVDRIVNVFPGDQQNQVVTQLANCLLAVISQWLLPRADGQGRVLAVETMIINPGIRACIRDHKPHMITGQIEIGAQEGMNTLDESLARLCEEGLITHQEALSHARDPNRIPKPAPKKKGFFG
ncbi:MAG TPA: PilT/PilU family type 4a pilus ATPase [Candidatus Methylacidiphilales bacterium]|nr:PilT/PilU family type 4a pilus ATPase [Candidatus Methylacidiphilales bacterium]